MSYIYPDTTGNQTKYKVYFVHQKKKIYLGIFDSESKAQEALDYAKEIMQLPFGTIDLSCSLLDYKKYICLCNLRDYKVYIKNPIYLQDTFFYYYLSKEIILTFDMKDLLFFSTYKIYKRGNYLYTQDTISQQNLLSRFGILSHSVLGRDYRFKNNNPYDFRRQNIELINLYKGVTQKVKDNKTFYVASIYTDKTFILGYYDLEIEAAIAYNKAIDFLKQMTPTKREYVHNTIPFLTKDEYNEIYNRIEISPRLKVPSASRKRVLHTNHFRGVSQTPSGFRANIGYNKKQIHLGIYPTAKRAAQAYNFASFYLFGSSGHINDVTPLIHDSDSIKIANYLKKSHLTKGPITYK